MGGGTSTEEVETWPAKQKQPEKKQSSCLFL
jgi:hypothetical protein